MRRNYLLIPLTLFLIFSGCRRSGYYLEYTETVTDLGGGTGTVNWTSDKSYLISGFVFVNDGQVLTIEPGTVIRAKTGQGSLSSALIVARGGKIIAEGTSSDPIIFTVEGDDLEGSVPMEARGLWGGVIILGNARINTETGEDNIEGIPISEPRGIYGGADDDDNSGILRHISIRHGGTNIGEGNEINGLTLGGVGRQTIVEFVEVISNADDGLEIFGGTVNFKNIVCAFCGDDAFDFDQGYSGKGQFLLAINCADSDHAIECSGGLQPLQLLPEAFPRIQNATLIGSKEKMSIPLILFFNYGAATISNSIFVDAGSGIALQYNDLPGDSWSLFMNGLLTLNNNILDSWFDSIPALYCYNPSGSNFDTENDLLNDSLVHWGNSYEDIFINSSGSYAVMPATTVFPDMADYSNGWFEQVTYKGAFGSENWLEGWTLLHESGVIAE